VCSFIALEKGRSVFGWFISGMLSGIFAVVVVCAMPRRVAACGA